MRSERWPQVTEIFHVALASDPALREAFLADACGGDAVLRAEVEALVAAHDQAGPFGDTPLFVAALSQAMSCLAIDIPDAFFRSMTIPR